MRIREKLTILFAGLTGAMLLVAAFLGYYLVQRELTSKIERELAVNVVTHTNELNNNILSKAKLLEISWYNLEREAQEGTLTADRLSGYKQVDPELTDMYFGFMNGDFIDGSGWKPPSGYDPRQRPWYKEAVEAGRLKVTAPYLDMVTQQMALAIVMPIHDAQGQVYGVAGADVPLKTLLENLNWASEYEGGYAYLLDRNGVVLVHPESAVLGVNVLQSPDYQEDMKETIRRMLREEQGWGRYYYNGNSRLVYFKQVPAMQWFLVMSVPEDVVYAPLRQLAVWFLGLFLASMALVISFSFWVAKRLSQPIVALAAEVKRIGEGDLAAKVQASGYEELDELAASFNRMVEGLQQSFAEIARQGEDAAAQARSFQEMTGHLITEGESTQALMAVVTQDAIRLAGGLHSVISTLNETKDGWVVRQSAGRYCLPVGFRGGLSEGLTQEVLQRGEVVFVPDYHSYAAKLSFFYKAPIGSCIGLPLKLGKEIIGVLVVAWSETSSVMDAKAEAILRQYANIVSAALARAQDHESMYQLAYVDELTGLPNRRNFYRQLQEKISAGDEALSGYIFLLDLDNLKLINDSLGHSRGDHFICTVAAALKRHVPVGGMIARLGGDEFGLWLPETACKEAGPVAEQLLRAIEAGETVDEHPLHITASMGIAAYPRDGLTVEELLQNADAALYEAKDSGKNTWRMCTRELLKETREKLFLSNALRSAIANREFSLVFQPIVDAAKNLVAFEALLRWRSAEYGQVPPGKFIPLAEQCGLMPRIGLWVLEEACRFADNLRQQGLGAVRVHVNVSTQQLEDEGFCSMVEDLLHKKLQDRNAIILEVTESVFMASIGQAVTSLHELKQQGLTLSMDDFGEGFSSLAQLLRLPFESLKISRTLVQNLGDDERHMQYIAAIVEMMHALNMEVVAEGVETELEWQSVGRCGFDLVQGYYIARPLTADAALEWAQENKNQQTV
ncbi:EAL domain-containing protein [uncultured Anaeromusa sp.]|uniref:bifunctional diguanylate cyclase/phosphodiesterase n=1 Tax=uncultured Anaeromusa sp. TaxID=673273 RepID=UPI0029C8F0C4|nr:EAL domain-containing protein [uncultured Anaeromusa sp.]